MITICNLHLLCIDADVYGGRLAEMYIVCGAMAVR